MAGLGRGVTLELSSRFHVCERLPSTLQATQQAILLTILDFLIAFCAVNFDIHKTLTIIFHGYVRHSYSHITPPLP